MHVYIYLYIYVDRIVLHAQENTYLIQAHMSGKLQQRI